MRKLILKDSDGWLTEVDPKALHREALMLKAYIEKASCGEEKLFKFRQKLLPLVESALDGTLTIPFKGEGPYSIRWMMEGSEPWLPEPLGEAYFAFMGRIRGTAHISAPSYLKAYDIKDYIPEVIEKKGKRYEWVEFED